MTPSDAFAAFDKRVRVPAKSTRLAALVGTKKGQPKILNSICHEFDPAVRPTALRERDYSNLWERPCFVFYSPLGFGVEFTKLRDAYEQLSINDSWLIVLQDASV